MTLETQNKNLTTAAVLIQTFNLSTKIQYIHTKQHGTEPGSDTTNVRIWEKIII
jgi:hypothetical protein